MPSSPDGAACGVIRVLWSATSRIAPQAAPSGLQHSSPLGSEGGRVAALLLGGLNDDQGPFCVCNHACRTTTLRTGLQIPSGYDALAEDVLCRIC